MVNSQIRNIRAMNKMAAEISSLLGYRNRKITDEDIEKQVLLHRELF